MSKIATPLLQKYLNLYQKDPHSRVFAPLAETYRSLGMTDKAFEILKKGISKHPDYVMGYLCLAACYADINQWQNVYSTLRPFVAKNRDNIRLQKYFGQACLQIAHTEEALETYKYLLFINPKDQEAYQIVNKLEDEQQHSTFVADDDKQVEMFEVEKLESMDDDIEQWEAVTFGNNDLEKDNVDSAGGWALESFSLDSLESHPKDQKFNLTPPQAPSKSQSVITHTLVDLYCSQGHLDKALEVVDKILELNPESEETRVKRKEILELLTEVQDKESEPEEEQEDDEHEKLLKDIDKIKIKTRSGQQQKKIEILNSFLSKIKYQARLKNQSFHE